MHSDACDLSINSMGSVESVISPPSITNYHSEGPRFSTGILSHWFQREHDQAVCLGVGERADLREMADI